jgi:hypothetical protein
MKLLKTNIYVPLVCFLMSFSLMKDGDNQNGGPLYTMSNTDGVFTIYRVTKEFNFGQPPVNNTKYIAYFLQSRGDTTTKFFNGGLTFSNHSLVYLPISNYYTDSFVDSTGNNGYGNHKWEFSANINSENFTYHYLRGQAKVELKNADKLEDTIRIVNDLNINFSEIKNADSIVVTVTAFNGMTLNKRGNGLMQNAQFTSAELSNFISGGIISISAFNILPQTINNKNYLFGSVHQYLKLVYFKN